MLDSLLKRDPYTKYADNIFELCASGILHGYIAGHSFSDGYYILRKYFSDEERRKVLLKVCSIVSVVGIDGRKIVNALKRSDFSDFEDCLQSECALECGADYIVTRNVKDYALGGVKPITAEDFLKKFDKQP